MQQLRNEALEGLAEAGVGGSELLELPTPGGPALYHQTCRRRGNLYELRALSHTHVIECYGAPVSRRRALKTRRAFQYALACIVLHCPALSCTPVHRSSSPFAPPCTTICLHCQEEYVMGPMNGCFRSPVETVRPAPYPVAVGQHWACPRVEVAPSRLECGFLPVQLRSRARCEDLQRARTSLQCATLAQNLGACNV